jgi:protein gp37
MTIPLVIATCAKSSRSAASRERKGIFVTKTKIEWADRSDWNPLRGCTRVSPGCGGPGPHGGCYAEAIAARFSDPGQAFHGFAERTKSGPRWTGRVELIEERLTAPLRWRKPARIFALSMSDLFHESVPDEWIDRIFAVMALCPQHTFQILTKRAERMRDWFARMAAVEDNEWLADPRRPEAAVEIRYCIEALARTIRQIPFQAQVATVWPLPNVWLGVSAEDQPRWDERWPALAATPAVVRWISYEPALGPLNIDALAGPDWLVIGGESGPGARPFKIEWARSIIGQCKAAGMPVFMKQVGSCFQAILPPEPGRIFPMRDRKGGNPMEWPSDLRVREYPTQERA